MLNKISREDINAHNGIKIYVRNETIGVPIEKTIFSAVVLVLNEVPFKYIFFVVLKATKQRHKLIATNNNFIKNLLRTISRIKQGQVF